MKHSLLRLTPGLAALFTGLAAPLPVCAADFASLVQDYRDAARATYADLRKLQCSASKDQAFAIQEEYGKLIADTSTRVQAAEKALGTVKPAASDAVSALCADTGQVQGYLLNQGAAQQSQVASRLLILPADPKNNLPAMAISKKAQWASSKIEEKRGILISVFCQNSSASVDKLESDLALMRDRASKVEQAVADANTKYGTAATASAVNVKKCGTTAGN